VSKGVASEAEKQAKAVVASPPAQAKKKTELTPAPVVDRSTMLPKEETTTVKLADKPAKQTVEQSKAVVAKSIASAPKNSSGQLLREQWLLKQKPSSYTIQLVGFQDEKGIAKFVQRHSLSGSVAYYRTQRNGKPWFPVLYGVYSTRSRAVAARGNLPKSLIDSGPWLRTMSAVQKDIRAR
jgi:DamX protein